MPLDIIKYLDDKNKQKDDKKASKIKEILGKILSFMVFLVIFALTKGCIYGIFHGAYHSNEHYTETDIKVAKDVGFIKGFEMANTTVLESYCSESGYIPKIYITEFKKQFLKTLSNADTMYSRYFNTPKMKKNFEDKVFPVGYNNLENEFYNLNQQYGISKKEYCKIFDEQKDTILQEKKKILKQQQANMYLD